MIDIQQIFNEFNLGKFNNWKGMEYGIVKI